MKYNDLQKVHVDGRSPAGMYPKPRVYGGRNYLPSTGDQRGLNIKTRFTCWHLKQPKWQFPTCLIDGKSLNPKAY